MVTLVHTSEVHVATFDALRDRIAPEVELHHLVREDWLSRARKGEDLGREIANVLGNVSGPILCTCTSIGPAAAQSGAIRVDAPMMTEAADLGGPILMVYALESTLEPSLELLEFALAEVGKKAIVRTLSLAEFWPLFEAGQTEAFVACVATGVREAVKSTDINCVVLAQASMALAAERLNDLGVPVLSSPETALRAALAG